MILFPISTLFLIMFSIIDEFNMVYEFDDVFYSAEAAETEGRAAIKTASW